MVEMKNQFRIVRQSRGRISGFVSLRVCEFVVTYERERERERENGIGTRFILQAPFIIVKRG